ncbi:acetate/propionate family kinase [Ensifer sp. LCM 4579]|uniref:acetate/propionate family kinase n=1 Tax=Ensifer sp. LCM 4579 TaxID=1848292 RepID=UPI0008DA2E40|nr:acetate/propionate family kinase [Ensifer sp. LCM 4579]OHV79930.1 acetate kinase [Ensifer sp. LCM 4579]
MDSILVVNAGSSSLKFQLFSIDEGHTLERLLKGQLEGIGTRPRLVVRDAEGQVVAEKAFSVEEVKDLAAAQDVVGTWLIGHIGAPPTAVGHRVVHGGPFYNEPTAVDDQVLVNLEKLVSLAPLHQPNNLAPIRSIRRQRPDLTQVACFDTAFHRGHPDVADRFAIPETFYREGVRRYGFHGLSYEYIVGRLREVAPDLAKGRVIVAHLGSGCSMCALVGGRSVESTMGFTALDGLPMGTRPGQLDAGVVLYLLAEKQMDVKAVEHLLYHDCGLKGLSGISSDMRELIASSDERARLALEYFVYRVSMAAGALAAAMGGLDGFVFTAGIGENAPGIRQTVAERMAWLGIEVDPIANAEGGPRISSAESRVTVLTVPTDEERMIADHTLAILRQNAR